MNLVIVSENDDVLTIAPDAITLDVFPDPEPDVLVSLNGIPGPRGLQGPQGQKGETGSIGDVTATAPLYYSPSTNTVFMDTTVFDVAGAAATALAAARAYVDGKIATVPTKVVYTQSSASNSWVIHHNLNTRPNVTIIDSAGREVFGDIYYDDVNNLHINFAVAFSGTAYLI